MCVNESMHVCVYVLHKRHGNGTFMCVQMSPARVLHCPVALSMGLTDPRASSEFKSTGKFRLHQKHFVISANLIFFMANFTL